MVLHAEPTPTLSTRALKQTAWLLIANKCQPRRSHRRHGSNRWCWSLTQRLIREIRSVSNERQPRAGQVLTTLAGGDVHNYCTHSIAILLREQRAAQLRRGIEQALASGYSSQARYAHGRCKGHALCDSSRGPEGTEDPLPFAIGKKVEVVETVQMLLNHDTDSPTMRSTRECQPGNA